MWEIYHYFGNTTTFSYNLTRALTGEPLLERFDCWIIEWNIWLHQHAVANQESCASRISAIYQEQTVIDYYSLASGALAVKEALGRLHCNMSEPHTDDYFGAVGGSLGISRI